MSVVCGAVQMAAEARRINDDLYHNAPLESTPLEDYMAENDGFEEVGDGAPDVSLDGSEDSEIPDGTDDDLDGTDAGQDGTANESEDGDES